MMWFGAAWRFLVANWKGALAAIGMALLTLAVGLIRKSGEDAQKARQAKIDEKAGKIITQERTEAQGMSDEKLNEEVEKWSRHT
jgi:hypothetical protein